MDLYVSRRDSSTELSRKGGVMPRVNGKTLDEKILAVIKAGKADKIKFSSMDICAKIRSHKPYSIIFRLHEMVGLGILEAEMAAGESTFYRLALRKTVKE